MNSSAPLFFVVSGAHGVGKTTALEAAIPMLKQRGLKIRQFHHVTDVMPGKSNAPKRPRLPQPPSSWRRRIIPVFIKQIVASIRDELTYIRGINRILREAAEEGQIAVSDRYAYDRHLELRLRNRPIVQRAAVRIVCSLMRRPTLTILLADDPAAIFHRKQELTVAEIAKYQDDFISLCEHLSAPLVVETVDGKGVNGVARMLVGTIIANIRESGYTVRC